MKKFIFFSFLFISFFANAQNHECVFPDQYPQITDGNMTVVLTQSSINDLPIFWGEPYIVAKTESGLIVGRTSLTASNLINGQQTISVWGDDVMTPEIDGALAGEELYFQVVQGNSLFDINFNYASSGGSVALI